MNSAPPPPPPAPLIPSAQTAFAMQPMGPVPPAGHLGPMGGGTSYIPIVAPASGPMAAPPPPGPPPPPPSTSQSITPKRPSVPNEAQPTNDARSDLLAAIRMGRIFCAHECKCKNSNKKKTTLTL